MKFEKKFKRVASGDGLGDGSASATGMTALITGKALNYGDDGNGDDSDDDSIPMNMNTVSSPPPVEFDSNIVLVRTQIRDKEENVVSVTVLFLFMACISLQPIWFLHNANVRLQRHSDKNYCPGGK